MKDTKRKILDTALALFNRDGSAPVTVRHIAAELGISHGNLCYHFPNTDAIITQLYEQLADELNTVLVQAIAHLQTQPFSLFWMFETTEPTFGLFYKYRFLMLEFVTIMRRIDGIRIHYQGLQETRRAQFLQIFALMQHQGYLIPEPLPGTFDLLVELMMMNGDFWLSSAEILFKGDKEAKIRHYGKLFHNLFVPYFTPKGLQEYQAYYAQG